MNRLIGTTLGLALMVLGGGCARTPVVLTAAESELAKAIGLPEAVLARAKAEGVGELQRLMGNDGETGDERALPGFTVEVPEKKALAVVAALRKELGSQGFLVFRSRMSFGIGGEPDLVAVLRGTDPVDILRGMGTDGINWDITNEMVIARYREWDARYGLVLNGAALDWLEAAFTKPPADMDAFAAEVYGFCPDVVDQGAGDVKKLAREMKRTNSVYLWWD